MSKKPNSRRKHVPSAAAQQTELVTPERTQHDVIELQETIHAGVKRGWVATQTSLRRYCRRRLLSRNRDEAAKLLQAAEEYASLSYLAGRAPLPKSGNLLRVDNNSAETEKAEWAREKIRRADSCIGPTHASCLFAVCVEDWSADAWARARGYRRNGTGLAYLIDGLKLLRKHWAI